jgi:hypothetical protein
MAATPHIQTLAKDQEHHYPQYPVTYVVDKLLAQAGPGSWKYSLTGTESLTRMDSLTKHRSDNAARLAVGLAGAGTVLAFLGTLWFTFRSPSSTIVIGAWAVAGFLLLIAAIIAWVGLRDAPITLEVSVGSSDAGGHAGPSDDIEKATKSLLEYIGDIHASNGHVPRTVLTKLRTLKKELETAMQGEGANGFATAHSTASSSSNGAAPSASGQSADAPSGEKKDPANTISPKVVAGGVAGALSVLFWTLAGATFWKSTLSTDTIATLASSTTTLLSAFAAYVVKDTLRVTRYILSEPAVAATASRSPAPANT